MNSPESNSQWLADVQRAYEDAVCGFENGLFGLEGIEELYKSAARIAASNRGINDQVLIDEMYSFSAGPVEHDLSLDPAEGAKYKFQFVIAYVRAHEPAGYVTEIEAGRIMDYVNAKCDLFEGSST